MKRITALLLTVSLLFCLIGCKADKPEIMDPVRFYYLRIQDPNKLYHGTTDSVILPEIREGQSLRQDYTALINLYLQGPLDSLIRSPFPSGSRLLNWTIDNEILSLTLSTEYASLTALDLTLANACLALTCLNLTELDTIQIQAENADLDGKPFFILHRSDLMFTDDSDITNKE